MRKSALAPLGALVLAACTTAGPDYHPPKHAAANLPSAQGAFQSANDAAFAQAPPPDHWWRLYADPRLDALIEQALTANTDLRVAEANLKRADAVLHEAEAGRTISTTATAGDTLARPSGRGASLPGTVSYDLGLSASYPLDLSGRIRRAIEASAADREAVLAARDRQCLCAGLCRQLQPRRQPARRRASARHARRHAPPRQGRARHRLRCQPRASRRRCQRSDAARLCRPAPDRSLSARHIAGDAPRRLPEGCCRLRNAPHPRPAAPRR